MKSRIKKILIAIVAIVLVAVIGYGTNYIRKNGPIGTGYTAKILCSVVFVSERDPETAWKEELWAPAKYGLKAKVDKEAESVTASLPGIVKIKRTAIYREGLGCTLVVGKSEDEIRKQPKPEPSQLTADQSDLPWPAGDRIDAAQLPQGLDTKKIEKALDDAFSEPDPEHAKRTRGIVVVYDGQIIAERYAQGFSMKTRQHGWSMTKSVTSALIGILVKQGKLDVYKPAPVKEWKGEGDPRGKITTDQLLRMSSGLEFLEEYEDNPASDAGNMFFTAPSMAAFAANKPLEVEPDIKWSYSSGTSNILARIVRDALGGTHQDYLSFPREELFDKLGMSTALIEPDAEGNFVGAGYMYASARDWARFGLLYLNDGVWQGTRILPEGWVEYTRSPTPNTPPDRSYGAQWWLNASDEQWMPKLPMDLYSARGHDGQYVTVVPSHKLVVVRLGHTVYHLAHWDHEGFILSIIDALPK